MILKPVDRHVNLRANHVRIQATPTTNRIKNAPYGSKELVSNLFQTMTFFVVFLSNRLIAYKRKHVNMPNKDVNMLLLHTKLQSSHITSIYKQTYNIVALQSSP